ncbi:MAG: GNAT family N-acetyltransferase [Chloroflexi bacterium]|nr:GNAT family N-acetyltransferase [Chloroflexota bacterium]
MSNVAIVEGIEAKFVDEALRLVYDAFAKKFRLGFRDADDLIRLFRDSFDTTSCFSATVDGRFAGILTFRAGSREFYRLSLAALFLRFTPVRALRILGNLLLLSEGVGPDEFIVESLAVDPSIRGLGLGTALMQAAEAKARDMGKHTMSLGVITENEGAIRLYQRLGYTTTKTWDGLLVRLASGSTAVHRMEKSLGSSWPQV